MYNTKEKTREKNWNIVDFYFAGDKKWYIK